MQYDATVTNKKTRTVLTGLLFLLAVPILLAVGVFILHDRSYYLISLLLIICSMIPFVWLFERRKPQARELVVLATLIALAVAGRAAFFMLPQVKPVIAIVILAAVCLGAESGFLVGAMTGFVSNFFFGQGPWTPWQMFCFGLIGYLAGVLVQSGWLPAKKIPLCIFGGLATFLIYGGIMDPAAVLVAQGYLSWQTVLVAYGAGVWFNLIHAVSTVVFLFLFYGPLTQKLERVKNKYGLLDG